MPSAYDLYTFYLEPADLRGQSHTVKITAAKAEPIFDPITKRDINKIVLYFENRKKTMPLNKTQVEAVINATGTDDFSKWAGAEIILTATQARNNKQTIAITPAKLQKAE